MRQCYRACKSKTCGKALFVMFRLGVERTRQRTHPTGYDTHTRGSARRRRQQTNKGSVEATIDAREHYRNIHHMQKQKRRRRRPLKTLTTPWEGSLFIEDS